eukprot:UN03369
MAIMVAKHTLHAIVHPEKYVNLASALGRKHAKCSKEEYMEHWKAMQKRRSEESRATIEDSTLIEYVFHTVSISYSFDFSLELPND